MKQALGLKAMAPSPTPRLGSFYAHCGYTEVERATYRDAPLIYYELLLA
jgi:hypothetical protein